MRDDQSLVAGSDLSESNRSSISSAKSLGDMDKLMRESDSDND